MLVFIPTNSNHWNKFQNIKCTHKQRNLKRYSKAITWDDLKPHNPEAQSGKNPRNPHFIALTHQNPSRNQGHYTNLSTTTQETLMSIKASFNHNDRIAPEIKKSTLRSKKIKTLETGYLKHHQSNSNLNPTPKQRGKKQRHNPNHIIPPKILRKPLTKAPPKKKKNQIPTEKCEEKKKLMHCGED